MERETTLGVFIRNERLRKGLTIAKAANLAGVSWRHWNAMESGVNISVLILRKVAAVLNLTNVPIGGGVFVTRNEATVDAGVLLDLAESLAARVRDADAVIDRLRDLAITAMLRADPMMDTASVKDLFEKHPELSEEEGNRLARTAHRLSKDAAHPEPVMGTSAAPAAKRKRRKA